MGAGAALLSTASLLVELVFELYIFAVVLRFLLQWVKADFYNPLCQFLVKLTNPLLKPLRRVIPGLWGLDLAAIVLCLILELVQLVIVLVIQGVMPGVGLIILVPAGVIQMFINVLLLAVIARAIMSWVNNRPHHPLWVVLVQLTEPFLSPIRNRLPAMGGFDLSPLILLIILQLITTFLKLWLGV